MVPKRSVLLALTDTHHGFFKGAARYAREHRWHVVADMIYTAKIPVGWRGDGILSFIGDRDDIAEFILSSGLPAVEISMVRNEINLPRVEGDSEMIGRLAAEHFLERGFRHFAWAPFLNDVVNAERYRGFANRLAREKFTCHLLPAADTRDGDTATRNWAVRRKLLTRELKGLPKPLAVFGYNDCVAADIIDACDVAGLLVPEAVAVMGVDNDLILCECVRVPLSSVCHDLEGMAYQAAALLDRLMAGRKPPKAVIRVPPKGLVTRRSTDIVAVDNLQVARALRYVQDHYTNPLLGVESVVAATDFSRRPLEIAFRQEMQRTLNEEIVRVRMEKVKELLTTTNMKVVDVAAATGFARPSHLFRTFRKLHGISPKTFRNREALKARPPTPRGQPLAGPRASIHSPGLVHP
jgi:LacI family transcriptional regulator